METKGTGEDGKQAERMGLNQEITCKEEVAALPNSATDSEHTGTKCAWPHPCRSLHHSKVGA